MRGLAIALLVPLLLAGCSSTGPTPPSPAAGEPLGSDSDSTSFPTRYYLNATLAPPITRYNVVSVNQNPLFGAGAGERALENGTNTFAWSNSNACGRFEKLGNVAIWHHGDDTNCPHDSPSHPGKVVVVIGGFDNATASTGYGTCEYDGGSNTGRSAMCFVSSVAPEGAEPARRTSLPWPSVPLAVAAVLGVALLLAVRRR